MNQKKLNLFISYSHTDKDYLKDFKKHLAPIINKGLVSLWVDQNIRPGDEFQTEIDGALSDSDLICLLVSSNFLSSDACLEEKAEAVKLKKSKGVPVIPIILTDCGWQDDNEISQLLALPTDGTPISNISRSDTAWNDVYKKLKIVIDSEFEIRNLTISKQFLEHLQNTELFKFTGLNKIEINLEQIFVYPKFAKIDDLGKFKEIVDSKNLLENFLDQPKLLIAGEDQSGKTSLCKKLFFDFRSENFVPIYLSDKGQGYVGKIQNQLSSAYTSQYETNLKFENLDKARIVPIIDDFHKARHKERLIDDLADYPQQVVVVDDIFCLNIKDESIINSFQRYKIEELAPLQRDELIKKWIDLTESESVISESKNSLYQKVDKKTELVNSTLGKSIGRGIMPSYPFFILMVINTYESFSTPYEQEITSQGHCYHALIYIYLRKQNVKNDDVDTYLNFLTEFAFYMFEHQKYELSETEFDGFIQSYTEKFNLPVNQMTLLSTLFKANILLKNSLNNYIFSYSYLYFFFVGKYFADNLENKRDSINDLLKNLDIQANAYIAIFLSHHSKNVSILNDTISVASDLYKKFEPVTLMREGFTFFDDQMDVIAQAVLPKIDNTPERARENKLIQQAKIEQINEEEIDYDPDESARELRRSIKTVDVMGTIIKNRAGSLEKNHLESVFEAGIKVHFRSLQSFIEQFINEEAQELLVNYISRKLKLISENEGKNLSEKETQEIAKLMFWNINFSVVYGAFHKVIHSLGSDKLTEIIKKYCDRENTPATFLVKHGILMWYNKSLEINDIKSRIEKPDFSKTAKRVAEHMVVDHCRFHQIDYRDRQKIENSLKIPKKYLFKK